MNTKTTKAGFEGLQVSDGQLELVERNLTPADSDEPSRNLNAIELSRQVLLVNSAKEADSSLVQGFSKKDKQGGIVLTEYDIILKSDMFFRDIEVPELLKKRSFLKSSKFFQLTIESLLLDNHNLILVLDDADMEEKTFKFILHSILNQRGFIRSNVPYKKLHFRDRLAEVQEERRLFSKSRKVENEVKSSVKQPIKKSSNGYTNKHSEEQQQGNVKEVEPSVNK
jgi:hypothetical protein